MGQLIIKPLIFFKDDKPEEPPLYPRKIMEQLAQHKSDNSQPESGLERWINLQRELIFNSERPFRAIGSIFLLICFVLFVLADAIAVAQTLIILGVGLGDLPPIFDRFDIAVLGGALLSAIVGVWVYADLLGDKSALFDTMNQTQRGFWKTLAFFLFFFAFIVMTSFAIDRLIALGKLPSNPTISIILDSMLYGLVPINNTMGAAICFLAAIHGFMTLLFLLAYIILKVFPVLMFFVDIFLRILYVVFDALIWALFTPFIVIPIGISKLIKMVNPQS